MKKFYLRFVNVFLALVLAAQTATPVFAIADGDKAETLPALPITELTEGENTNPESTLPTADLADAENVNSEPTLPMTDLTDAEPQSEPATPSAQTAEEQNKETNPAPSAEAEGGENIEKAPVLPAPELAEAKTVEAENQSLAAVPANTYPITTQVIGGEATVHVDKSNAKQSELVTIEITDSIEEHNKLMIVKVQSADSGKTESYDLWHISDGLLDRRDRRQFEMPNRPVIVKVEFIDMLTIVHQPVSQNVIKGEDAIFKIETKGWHVLETLSYQWQTLDNSNWWVDIEGATNSYYIIKDATVGDNGKQFRCKASIIEESRSSVISNAATLTVQDAQPTDRTIIAVQDAQPIVVRYHETINRLNLPKEVTVTLSDNTQKQMNVAWDLSNYEKRIAGDYILLGNLVMESGITNTKQLQAKIKVTVGKDQRLEMSYKDSLISELESAYQWIMYIPFDASSVTEKLIQAMINAEAVIAMENPTPRDCITAEDELNDAKEQYKHYNNSDQKSVSRYELEDLVKHAWFLKKATLYTEKSRNLITDKANAAQKVLDNNYTTPEDWSDAFKELIKIVHSLERVKPSEYPGKNALKALLRIAREKSASDKYTQESLKGLNKAIKTAQDVFDNKKADSQQVFDASWAIRDAIDLLEEKPYKPSRGGGGGSRRRGGSSGGSGGGSSDGGNYVQPQTDTIWDINNSLTKSKYGINVTINADDKLSTAFLNELIANKNKSVTLKGAWYNWDFYGTSIENTMPGVVWFDTTISTVTPNQAQISKLTGKNDTTVLHFAHQGKLAGKTKITVDIDKYANKKMFVYQYNAAKARLELVQANVNVNANGVMAFTITEGADYIISPTAVKGAVIVPKPAPKPVKKTAVKPVPKK